MKKQIAEKLIRLRGTKSRLEVAKSIGISKSTLQMYENGRRMPKDNIKVKLASYYGVSVQHLFFDHSEHDSYSA